MQDGRNKQTQFVLKDFERKLFNYILSDDDDDDDDEENYLKTKMEEIMRNIFEKIVKSHLDCFLFVFGDERLLKSLILINLGLIHS